MTSDTRNTAIFNDNYAIKLSLSRQILIEPSSVEEEMRIENPSPMPLLLEPYGDL